MLKKIEILINKLINYLTHCLITVMLFGYNLHKQSASTIFSIEKWHITWQVHFCLDIKTEYRVVQVSCTNY